MKCLLINGSPRKGMTWQIAMEIKEKWRAMGDITFEEVMLKDADIPMCGGCFRCFTNGEDTCPHVGRVAPVVQKIKEADILVITSPIYALHVSALLKNFFDHTAYCFHRPAMFDKRALVITSTAGAGAKKTALYIRDTLKHWGFNRVYILPYTMRGRTDITEKDKKRGEDTAVKLYQEAKCKKIYPPTFKRVLYYNLWRGLNTLPTALPADRNYWETTGFKNHPWPPGKPIGFIKKAFGYLCGGLFGKMFT